MKVVTSIVALDHLGPNHRGYTELRSAAAIEAGVLRGDLVLVGGADPELGVPQLWALLLDLRQAGVHTIEGRGTVVSGRVERGVLKAGDKVEIVGLDNQGGEVVVTSVQSFHKSVDEARAGMNVGLLLRGLKRDDVERGQVLSAPGAIKAHAKGRAQIFVLTKEDGGRHTPFTSGYTPQFFFGATDVSGTIAVDGGAFIAPGDQAEVGFELQKPVGLEQGVRFAIREGGKTVGAGLVMEVA
jgi:elongation factor Tu